MGCFVRGGKNGMGCYVRGDKNRMGCYVRGDKNSMGCFVRGGKSLGMFCPGCQKMAWDVLSRDVLSGSRQKHYELAIYIGLSRHYFCPEYVVCFLSLLHLRLDSSVIANNMNPDQTALLSQTRKQERQPDKSRLWH